MRIFNLDRLVKASTILSAAAKDRRGPVGQRGRSAAAFDEGAGRATLPKRRGRSGMGALYGRAPNIPVVYARETIPAEYGVIFAASP